ncbi:hypothetical protein [Methylocaldum sp. GT1TLB]|jgi:hypothetical protein|uniref:hypothetical protein n=1 Tax=Methylocaldum sp. GT1TLB TaxID=3438965 RepID=UPI003DA09B8C
MQSCATWFFDNDDGCLLAEAPDILSIPLREGMRITIHGQDGEFRVVGWDFHYGHRDEKGGLRIYLGK